MKLEQRVCFLKAKWEGRFCWNVPRSPTDARSRPRSRLRVTLVALPLMEEIFDLWRLVSSGRICTKGQRRSSGAGLPLG